MSRVRICFSVSASEHETFLILPNYIKPFGPFFCVPTARPPQLEPPSVLPLQLFCQRAPKPRNPKPSCLFFFFRSRRRATCYPPQSDQHRGGSRRPSAPRLLLNRCSASPYLAHHNHKLLKGKPKISSLLCNGKCLILILAFIC